MARQLIMVLVVCVVVSHAVNASATPVSYELTPTVTADVTGPYAYEIFWRTPLLSGSVTGGGNLSGQIAFFGSANTETASIDWGSPGWSGELAVSLPRFEGAGASGPVRADGHVDVVGLFDLSFGLSLAPVAATFAPLDTSGPLVPAESSPGHGPWAATLADRLAISFRVEVCMTVLITMCIPHQPAVDGQLVAGLERTGVDVGNPAGTGSRLTMGAVLPTTGNLWHDTLALPGCETFIVLSNCTLDIERVVFSGNIAFTNMRLALSGTSSVAIPYDEPSPVPVPEPNEPAMFALLAAGLAGLSFVRGLIRTASRRVRVANA